MKPARLVVFALALPIGAAFIQRPKLHETSSWATRAKRGRSDSRGGDFAGDAIETDGGEEFTLDFLEEDAASLLATRERAVDLASRVRAAAGDKARVLIDAESLGVVQTLVALGAFGAGFEATNKATSEAGPGPSAHRCVAVANLGAFSSDLADNLGDGVTWLVTGRPNPKKVLGFISHQSSKAAAEATVVCVHSSEEASALDAAVAEAAERAEEKAAEKTGRRAGRGAPRKERPVLERLSVCLTDDFLLAEGARSGGLIPGLWPWKRLEIRGLSSSCWKTAEASGLPALEALGARPQETRLVLPVAQLMEGPEERARCLEKFGQVAFVSKLDEPPATDSTSPLG
eukprot:CAMPEP_0172644324 /NCGR_PEP_ID=MMETSP1068-20121228/239151_1 /TAXON_ID=35684 /ORGANISM="Pseudopedinella elastica, Strain CCMP716" /LENGTH=344 /DNA_ID=CAMNT_0013458517 /DNA_START=1227 /DNA_END=2257 /DNA_ORIENTATION=-